MAGVAAFTIGAEVLKALGMDPGVVRDFSIHFNLNTAVMLKADIYLTQEQVDAMVVVLKEYDVTLKERICHGNDPVDRR